MLNVIRQWVIKTMMKNNTGVVQTLPKRDLIELNTQITAQRLMQNGVDPQALKNVNQVENAVNAIESRPPVQQGIRSTKSAKVMDMEGKEIKDPKNIMGGKEINQQTLNEELMKTDNPYSDLVNTPRPKTIKEREAEVLAGMEKNNKEAAQRIRNRKMLDDAVDNASPGFVKGDRKYNAQLVADDLAEKKFGKDFYDLDQKQQMDLYGEALDGLSDSKNVERQFFKDVDEAGGMEEFLKKNPIDDPEDMAQGGRAGFRSGLGKRFLELLKNKKMFRSKDDVPTSVFSEKTGPITIEDMANIPEKELSKIRRTQELGLYDETPEILKAGNLFERFTKKVGDKRVIDYDRAGFILNRKLRGDETLNELLQIEYQTRPGRADGGRIGYFMGSANPKGLALLREILEYSSKKGKELDKFKGLDLSALDMLRLSNPKALNKMLDDVRGKVNIKEGIMGTDTVRAQQQALRKQRKDLTEKSLDVAKDMKTRDDAIAKRIAEEAEKTIIPQTKKMMMEGMGMSEEAAEKTARDMAEAAQNMRLTDDSPIITKEGILQLENVLKNMETGGKKKRDLNATGGRAGFDKGGMTRRTFLKLLGGLASIPIVGKILKPIKLAKGVKNVPIIKTDNIAGKPEWFDALVNKVIIEGDDVTKRFATGERQSIHQKTLDDGSVVRVTEDVDDGAVRVEYQSEQNVYGDDVLMEYKKPLPDEGDPNPAAEFSTAESGPVSRQTGPDDFDLDVDEVGGSSISDLDSDVSKLKEFATGKKPTMKEFVQNKKRKDKASAISNDIDGAASDAVIRRQGDYVPEYDDYASGGIARMLGE